MTHPLFGWAEGWALGRTGKMWHRVILLLENRPRGPMYDADNYHPLCGGWLTDPTISRDDVPPPVAPLCLRCVDKDRNLA